MIQTTKYFMIAALGLGLMAACHEGKTPDKKNELTKEIIKRPFRFQRTIEVKPGLTFDVLSWKRGADTNKEAYLILRADSLSSDYHTLSGTVEGSIVDAWNMDLDTDGNPEIIIEARGPRKSLNLLVFEYRGDNDPTRISVPPLRSATARLYRGRDSVFVRNGSLMRQFPTFEEADTAGLKPTGKKDIEYLLQGSSLVVK